ncbi:MAG: hypothetical protein OQK04_08125 [Kangiellaceae bacterium]|nr:hypothetical protein [Kangiellaceae bacterium]MCW8998666.1 hypothetical protein [Kangiellaceae bacterium]
MQVQEGSLWPARENEERAKLSFKRKILGGKPILLPDKTLYGISITVQLWRLKELEKTLFLIVSAMRC